MTERETPRWQWDTATKRYRDTRSGRFLGARRVHTLRDEYVDHRAGQMRGFVSESVDGVDRTDATAWRGAVRRVETLGWRRIENTLITEYVYGRGGINAMTDADRDRLRNLLREQKTYWNGFMREAYADPDKMTTAYMQNRATYYHRSSTGFFERAKARAWDVALPEYPGEQECKANCRCRWSIEEIPADDEVHAYWIRSAGDSCTGCVENEGTYNPLIIPRVEETGVFT